MKLPPHWPITGTLRHPHRPWTLRRWRLGGGSPTVVWSLRVGTCPRCSECGGRGYINLASHGEEPDFDECWTCSRPLLEIAVPDRLDGLLPGSPLRAYPASRPADGSESPF
ncbi:hypothetical protein AB0H71_33595 [Nocardia sp. NPDC050697]|uniref:hypothetical protein n=1 Tax=Nocardia sp. NPDC050697 TaxID=3155158 RepID=UPI0033ED8B61